MNNRGDDPGSGDNADEDNDSFSDTCIEMPVSIHGPSRKPKHHGSEQKINVQSNSESETDNGLDWDSWFIKKSRFNNRYNWAEDVELMMSSIEEILGLLEAPQYDIQSPHWRRKFQTVELPALYELEAHGVTSMEQRVFVINFKYSGSKFSEFAHQFPLYLELLEEAAGRSAGVVKVIMPRLFSRFRQPTASLAFDSLLFTKRSRTLKRGADHGGIVILEAKSSEQENVKYVGDAELESPDSVKDGFDFDRQERKYITHARSPCSTAMSTMKAADQFGE